MGTTVWTWRAHSNYKLDPPVSNQKITTVEIISFCRKSQKKFCVHVQIQFSSTKAKKKSKIITYAYQISNQYSAIYTGIHSTARIYICAIHVFQYLSFIFIYLIILLERGRKCDTRKCENHAICEGAAYSQRTKLKYPRHCRCIKSQRLLFQLKYLYLNHHKYTKLKMPVNFHACK